jgi:hypothetical protein
MEDSETDRVRSALKERDVLGADDFGTFVNNTTYFAPSRFDQQAAMPVLIEMLPTLNDEPVVATVARHLRGPWARPAAYRSLLKAFQRWAEEAPDSDAGWALGEALAAAATTPDLPEILTLAQDSRYGQSRQMIVLALYRFKTDDTTAALIRLIRDPEVALHAMSALRRVIGPEQSRPLIQAVALEYAGLPIADTANRELKKIDKRLATR